MQICILRRECFFSLLPSICTHSLDGSPWMYSGGEIAIAEMEKCCTKMGKWRYWVSHFCLFTPPWMSGLDYCDLNVTESSPWTILFDLKLACKSCAFNCERSHCDIKVEMVLDVKFFSLPSPVNLSCSWKFYIILLRVAGERFII